MTYKCSLRVYSEAQNKYHLVVVNLDNFQDVIKLNEMENSYGYFIKWEEVECNDLASALSIIEIMRQ